MAKKHLYAALSLVFIFLILFSGMTSIWAENASDLENITDTEGVIEVLDASDNTSVTVQEETPESPEVAVTSGNELKKAKIESTNKLDSKLKEKLENKLELLDAPMGIASDSEDNELSKRFLVFADSKKDAKKLGEKSVDEVALVEDLDLDGILDLIDNNDVEYIMEEPMLGIEAEESIEIINATSVWDFVVEDQLLNGDGGSVCVLDTGINYTSLHLRESSGLSILGPDFVNDDSDPMDDEGHGSHVAGIVRFTAPNSKVVGVKVCNSGGGCGGFDMIQGVEWCTANKDAYNISVITMSIGDYAEWNSGNCPTWMDTQLQAAEAAGITVTAASGNEGHTAGINYPACSPTVISVGASTKADGIAVMTNRGLMLDVLAPGTMIMSVDYRYFDELVMKSGTSMATPFVAASALILKQSYDAAGVSRDTDDIRQLLRDTAFDIIGYKRINLGAAVEQDNLTTVQIIPIPEQIQNSDKLGETLKSQMIAEIENITLGGTPRRLLIVAQDENVNVVGIDEKSGRFSTMERGVLNATEILDLSNREDIDFVLEDPILNTSVYEAEEIIGSHYTNDYFGLDGGGSGVCVLDTGIRADHMEFARGIGMESIVVQGPDFVNDDLDPSDDNGHGTHVNGIVTSVAPFAHLVNVKVCNADGGCSGFDMLQGVQWCNDNMNNYSAGATSFPSYRIRAISMSIGDYGEWNESNCPTWMDAELQEAYDNNIFVAAASGNEGHTSGINYPACSPYTTAVGASTKTDGIAVFTNRGTMLDLLAPGTSIFSADVNTGGGLTMKSGTSMATPFVAAAGAILMDLYEENSINKTPADIEQLLKDNSVDILGYDRLDLKAAANATGLVSEISMPCELPYPGAPLPDGCGDPIQEKIEEVDTHPKIDNSLKIKLIDELTNDFPGPPMPGAANNAKILVIASQGTDALDVMPFNPENEAVNNFGLVQISLANVDDILGMANNPSVEFVMEEPILNASNLDVVDIINSEDVNPLAVSGQTLDGTGTSICMIDTGVDYNHADLSGKIINGPDFVNDDSDSMDDNGHGTHIAGTMLSIAPETKVIAVKVCNAAGGCGGFDMIQGVEWCNANKDTYDIKSISISIGDKAEWTSASCPTWMDTQLQASYNSDIFVAAASGNEGYTSGINYPSCSPYATSVGASTKADGIAVASNRGLELDLVAPGTSIVSTCLGGGTCMKSGTSMATPSVATSATILKQYYELASVSKTNAEIEQLLKDTAFDIMGYKRIDLKAAVDEDALYNNFSEVCGMRVSGDMTLTEDVNCVGYSEKDYAININESDVVLDCGGHTISGDGKYGVYAYKQSSILGNVGVKNCKFQGFERGIHVQNFNNSLIEDNDIDATLYGIVVSGPVNYANVTVRNNNVTGNTGFGLYFHRVKDSLIEDNFVDGGANGLYMSRVLNATVKNNDIIGTGGTAMHLKPAKDSLFIGNNISDGNLGIRVFYQGGTASDNNVFDGNTITNNKWMAIWLYTADIWNNPVVDGTIIRNNYLFDNNKINHGGWYNAGIKVEGKNTLVENNTIDTNSAGEGILIFGPQSENNIIRNNTITNCSGESGSGIRIRDGPSGDIIENNTISDSVRGVYVWQSNATVIRGNEIFGISSSAIPLSSNTGIDFEIYNNNIHDNRFGIYFSKINHVDVHDNLITNNDKAGLYYRGILDPAVYDDLRVYHNNVYNNTELQVIDAGNWASREISYNNEGNYWGHTSGACFVPENDSNKAWIDDPYCYLSISEWDMGGSSVPETTVSKKSGGGGSSKSREPEPIPETLETVEIPQYEVREVSSTQSSGGGVATGHVSFTVEDNDVSLGEDIVVEVNESEGYVSSITGGIVGTVREGLDLSWLIEFLKSLFR